MGKMATDKDAAQTNFQIVALICWLRWFVFRHAKLIDMNFGWKTEIICVAFLWYSCYHFTADSLRMWAIERFCCTVTVLQFV